MFGCESLGKNQGTVNLSSGAPVGRSMPVVSRGRGSCKGAPSVGGNPVTDPSANTALLTRSSVHDDELSVFFTTRSLNLSLRGLKRPSKGATCMILMVWKL